MNDIQFSINEITGSFRIIIKEYFCLIVSKSLTWCSLFSLDLGPHMENVLNQVSIMLDLCPSLIQEMQTNERGQLIYSTKYS